MRNRSAKGSLGSTFGINVYPLMVAGHISKAVNTVLIDFQPIADPDFLANQAFEFSKVRILAHDSLPPEAELPPVVFVGGGPSYCGRYR